MVHTAPQLLAPWCHHRLEMADPKDFRVYSQPFSASGDDPRPKYRAFDLISNFVERVQESLDPDFKDLVHELSDGFFCLWTSRIVWYGC